MNKIDQLISQYSPAGVPMVRLGEVCLSVCTGLNPRENFVLNDEGACYRYATVKEIASDRLVFSSSTDKITPEAKKIINSRSKLATGDILFSGIGTIGKVYYVDIDTMDWDCSESVFVIKPNTEKINGKYLSYILKSRTIVTQYMSCAAGAIMSGVRKTTLMGLILPLPPLPVQEEIVRILDAMSDLVTNLDAEISARQKQYEHAREKLLTFGKEVERKTLGEIFAIRGGYTPSTNNPDFWAEADGFPWFKMEDIRDKGRFLTESYSHITAAAIKSNGLFPAGTIVFATSATIGEHAMLMVPALTNQRFTALIPKDDSIYMKYIFYYGFIIDKWCKENTIQGSFAGVNMVGFRNYPIPLPPLSVQQSIVERLDKMESLIQNLQAERALRQKQYEYYREKLLTF